jgi:hypothetical protein
VALRFYFSERAIENGKYEIKEMNICTANDIKCAK